MSVGVCILATTDPFQPQVGTEGARRTPHPHVAPSGSDLTMWDQTDSLVAGWY